MLKSMGGRVYFKWVDETNTTHFTAVDTIDNITECLDTAAGGMVLSFTTTAGFLRITNYPISVLDKLMVDYNELCCSKSTEGLSAHLAEYDAVDHRNNEC